MSRIVFFGTPEIALPTLDALHGSHEIGLVVTMPDRPRGRSGHPQPPPVKERGAELGMWVTQPTSKEALEEALGDAGPFDVGVVVAFGRILSRAVLDTPARGILNVHFSLLPRWRGAAPVARALMAGDPMTGITIIRLDEGLDTGPVLTAQALDIAPDENRGTLSVRLASVGARLLAKVLPDYLEGRLEPVPQTDEGATYAERVTPADRPLEGAATREAFVGKVRGLAPSPGATLVIEGERHKILGAMPSETAPPPGVWALVDGSPTVSVAGAGVALTSLQAPGRSVVSGADWARGRHKTTGPLG